MRCPWLLAQMKVATIFDIFPHGVGVLLTLLPFNPEGIVVGFYIFAWAPNSQKYEDSNEKKILGTPNSPLKKPIWGGQKPKWAVSPRRVYVTVLKFCMGS